MEELYHHTFANGFKTIYAYDRSNPLVSLQLYLRIGSNFETPQTAGFSHLIEHLVFKSTQDFPENKIMEEAARLGGEINAYTEYDSTCYYLTVPKEFFNEGLLLLANLGYKANFSEADVKFEKKVVLEECKQYQNDPNDFFIETISALYFTKNPYKNPIIGTYADIEKASWEDLRTFYTNFYKANNAFLVVTGDIPENASALTEKHFFSWQGGKTFSKPLLIEELPATTIYRHIVKKIRHTSLAFTVPELSELDANTNTLGLITKTFALGKTSRLFKRLFYQEKLVEKIRVHSLCGINSGISIIEILPRPTADCYQIIKIFREEFEKLTHLGLSVEEIENQKKELLHSYRYSMEYVENLGMSLGSEEILSDYQDYLKYPAALAKIDYNNVEEVLKAYYKPHYVNIFSMGKTALNEQQVETAFNLPQTISSPGQESFLEETLSNGMRLLYKRVKGKPTVGISLALPVSHYNEDLQHRGVNTFTAMMLLYGTKKFSHEQLTEFCSQKGISINATDESELTYFRVKCFKEQLPNALELLNQCVFYPTFPPEHFSNLKKSLIASKSRFKDSPFAYAQKLFLDMVFGANSCFATRTGETKSLRSITIKKVKDWYEECYLPKNMTLSIVGDLAADDLLYACENLFNFKGKEKKLFDYLPPKKLEKGLYKIKKTDLDQAIIHLGGFGCLTEETRLNTAFNVLAQIIGGEINSRCFLKKYLTIKKRLAQIIGGEINSRFFEELREKRGLAYSCSFDFNPRRHYGFFIANAIVDVKRDREALQEKLDNFCPAG